MVKTTYKLAAPFWQVFNTLRNRPISAAAGKTPALVLNELTLAEKLLAQVERLLGR